jgi:hypothetical protein
MDLLQLFPKLKEKSVTLSSLDISHRVFLNWKDKGIIDYTPEYTDDDITNKVSRKRIELNFFDALYLLIVKELRSLNIDLNSIKNIGEYLYSNPANEMFKDVSEEELKSVMYDFLKGSIENTVKPSEIPNKETILNHLENISDEYKIYFSEIGKLVNSVMLFGLTPSLIVYKTPCKEGLTPYIFDPVSENVYFSKSGKDYRDETIDKLVNYTILNIPIRPLIEHFFESDKLYRHAAAFALLTPSELELLHILRKKDFEKIIVYSTNTDNLIIEKTNAIDFKGEQAKNLRKILGLKQYEKAEVIFRNDKHLVIKNTIKQHLQS